MVHVGKKLKSIAQLKDEVEYPRQRSKQRQVKMNSVGSYV